MTTYIVQIGNSDNKLSQKQWTEFCLELKHMINIVAHQVHFSGHSNLFDEWQNYCTVFELDQERYKALTKELEYLRDKFGQDSIALTIGSTIFI